jgi:uncharacterized protein
LESFPSAGTIGRGPGRWGEDPLAYESKELPVGRLTLFIEESVSRETQFAVFEPNDERLWSEIRRTVGAFMHNLFRRGTFAGATPQEAYEVRCGTDTMTQADIDQGRVNILVAFAPLQPAEFVVVTIQQLAGQTEP